MENPACICTVAPNVWNSGSVRTWVSWAGWLPKSRLIVTTFIIVLAWLSSAPLA